MPRNALMTIIALMMMLLVTYSILLVSPVTTSPERAGQYTNANIVSPNIARVLAEIGPSLTPDQLALLKGQLKGAGIVTSGTTNPISQYLQTLTDLSTNMNDISMLLDHAHASLASGDTKSAEADLTQLNMLASATPDLLNSSLTELDQVTLTYGVNTSSQTQRIQQLQLVFQGYLLQISDLKDAVSNISFQPTFLALNVSRNEVFVDDNFTVSGILVNSNGTKLSQRNIMIAWGSNQLSVTTDVTGGYEVGIAFPYGARPGITIVNATYQPTGNDFGIYKSAYSAAQVTVNYEQTQITASLDRTTARPSDSVSVQGKLTSNNQTLGNQTITIQLDQTSVGNVTTAINGIFSYQLTIPDTIRNGTHTFTVSFIPNQGPYAPTNSQFPFEVTTIPTNLQVRMNQPISISGTNMTITGTVTDTSGTTINNGTLTIYLDNIFYANTTVRNGSFLYSLKLPLLFGLGAHNLTVEYTHLTPWIDDSIATTQVYVINTPAAALVVALAVGVTTFVWRRQRALPTLEAEAELGVPERRVAPMPISQEQMLSMIEEEPNNSLKVRRTYSLAQTLIDRQLGVAHPNTETHREYFTRVTKTLFKISNPLMQISQLFELAEYSPYRISDAESESALKALTRLQTKLKV